MCRCSCLFIFSCFLSYQVLLLYQEVCCHATASFPKIISCTRCLKIWPIGRPMRTKSSASMLGIANRAASSAWVIPVRAASQAKVWPLSSSVSRRKRPAWNSPGRKETLSLEVFAALLFIFLLPFPLAPAWFQEAIKKYVIFTSLLCFVGIAKHPAANLKVKLTYKDVSAYLDPLAALILAISQNKNLSFTPFYIQYILHSNSYP